MNDSGEDELPIPDVVSLSWKAIEEYVPRRFRTSCGDVDAVRFVRVDVRPELDVRPVPDIRHVVLTDETEDVVAMLDVDPVVEPEELLEMVVVT